MSFTQLLAVPNRFSLGTYVILNHIFYRIPGRARQIKGYHSMSIVRGNGLRVAIRFVPNIFHIEVDGHG